ncbi:MAG: phosphopantetheine-binding protein [Betaproteobacteria bacterium]
MSVESTIVDMTEFEREVAGLVIEALRLEITADAFAVEAPLYGGDLGLDSIDMLEIALAVSKRYGVEIQSDDVDTRRIFGSLRALAEHVGARRVR